MSHWFSIALIAYLIGALIEGVYTANQLAHSMTDKTEGTNHLPQDSVEPSNSHWHVFVAVASVSICGAFFWPCRLIHGAIKKGQPQLPD